LHTPLWVAIHPSGTSVLYREGDQAKLWDLSGEKPVEKLTLKRSGKVHRMAISPDGKKAVTACEGPDEVLLWSLESGERLLKIPHSGKVMAIAFSPDGRTLATANAGDVQLWNVELNAR
jgi:WD40 repeat protein